MPPPPPPGAHARPSQGVMGGVPIPSGRRLKVLEHRVHKVESGGKEDELVVSNLRPFTLKVGVCDHLDRLLLDCSLPLRATLLYENGLPVRQTSASEPLLVGESEVVALQGAATFKLKITSLSSHRDKQRFRLQVSPQDPDLAVREPSLSVVTNPMKSVTKLGRSSLSGGGGGGAYGGAAGAPPPAATSPGPEGDAAATAAAEVAPEILKRKHCELLETNEQQIRDLAASQAKILKE